MSVRRWIAAGATLALLLVATGSAGAQPQQAADGVVPAAYLYVPIDGGRAVARWNGKAAGYTVAKVRTVIPGRFDDQGGGAFLYRAGGAPDGVLRIRPSDSGPVLSLRTESVNGHYEPIAGDFDGNGFTDILWNEVTGSNNYLWLFRADGSHTSRRFDTGFDGTVARTAIAVDANSDGYDDLLWTNGDFDLWIMGPDARHTVRRVALGGMPGWTGVVAGNLGPDDGVTRRRMAGIYQGGYERLFTFNKAGQSTMKVVRPQTGTCCTYQRAYGGHFREGYAESLFFYSPIQPQTTEYLQDFTPGGNRIETPAPQIAKAYTINVADYDGNGYDDLLLTNRSGATILFSSDGTGFTKSDPADVPARSTVVAIPMG